MKKRPYIILIACTLFMAASVIAESAKAANSNNFECFKDSLKCNIFIGKRMWVRPIKLEKVAICPDDGIKRTVNDPDPCKYVVTGTFVIIGVVKSSEYSANFRVKLDNGKTALVGPSNLFSLSDVDPVAVAKAAAEDCAKRGPPKIEMTSAEATESCWGKPRRIVKTTTASGVREDYIYALGKILRFESGTLVQIIETRGE